MDLQDLGFDTYVDYINSPRWQKRRVSYYQRHRKACFVCEAQESIFLHHRTYARLGYERDKDLVPLCMRCHSLLHDMHAGLNKVVNRMRRAYLSGGEIALKPAIIGTRAKISVRDAAHMTDEDRARYALVAQPQVESVADYLAPRMQPSFRERLTSGS